MSARRETAAQALVQTLVANDVDTVFCVPGESYLAVLDALVDSDIKVVVCRQEGGAANMADAYGKLTGKPGICMVTRGPGATNASIGIHTAFQDSTPLIIFVGQVDGEMEEREAFQEIDYRQMFGGIAKWGAEIDQADRVPEMISRAFHVATSGRPGPVEKPEDVFFTAFSTDLGPGGAALPDLLHVPDQASQLRRAQRRAGLALAPTRPSKAEKKDGSECSRLHLPTCLRVTSFRRLFRRTDRPQPFNQSDC